VSHLIHRDFGHGLTLPDTNVGRTPLSLAVHSESGEAAVASASLPTGQVNLEAKSYCGSMPLRYVVLLGGSILSRDNQGRGDTTKAFRVENGQPKLLAMPRAVWDAPLVLDTLRSLVLRF
jgi:hypothetical protein